MRDRITGLRRVPAGDLRENPANWRQHPDEQRTALADLLGTVGLVDAVIARETPAGLELVDGHLRADLAAGETLPVLVVDLTDDEAAQVLATLDPIAALAVADVDRLSALVETLDSPPMDYTTLYGTLEKVELIEVGDPPDEPLDNSNLAQFRKDRNRAFLSIAGVVTPLPPEVVEWLGDDPAAVLAAAAKGRPLPPEDPF